jgi:hypothetical protein
MGSAISHHLQKTSSAMKIFLVLLEVTGKFVYLSG